MQKSTRSFLPEGMHEVDYALTLPKLEESMHNQEVVSGKIIRLDSQKGCLEVALGGGITGYIYEKDLTVYSTRKGDGTFHNRVINLVGKTICCLVTSIAHGNVTLNRKLLMEEALLYFQHINKIQNAYVTSSSSTCIYVDIGYGIEGMVHISALSACRFENVLYLPHAKTGSIISVFILGYDSKRKFFNLSHKKMFPCLSNILNQGDIITIIISEPVDDVGSGYFAYVNPATSAIVNAPYDKETNEYIHLEYGAHAIAIVRSVKMPEGKLKLAFYNYI